MSIPKVTAKVIGDRRRWRAYKARIRQLPESHRTAVSAIQRYLMFFGPADGSSAVSMFEDLADLFEQGVADGLPVRAIVGEDPVDFVETFVRNYAGGGYIDRERQRLLTAIERAEEQRS